MANRDDANRKSQYHMAFFLIYMLVYMLRAAYSPFLPIYLDSLGFNKSMIGILQAIGPLAAISIQPAWGLAGDRKNSKNTILRIMLLGSAITYILFPVSSQFLYIVFIIAAFSIFETSIVPMNDAITLEYIYENTQWKYGMIRLFGTIGYAAMAVIMGMIVKQNIYMTFIGYFILAMIAFVISFRLPIIKGHQTKQNKVPYRRLFENRELVMLLIFGLIIQVTLGMYYSFFPIYYKQLGAGNLLIGLSMSISALSEIPFLVFAEKIQNRINIHRILIISALIMGLRWLLLSQVTNIYAILLISVLHGFSYVVFNYCLVVYINQKVPQELKASGQTLNNLVSIGLTRIIGSLLGGFFSDRVGISTVFLYSFYINIAAVFIFGLILYMYEKNILKMNK